MPLTEEAQAAADQRAKDAEAAKTAHEDQMKAEAEAAEAAAESGASKFIVSLSGMGTQDEALDAFDAFVAGFDTINGSIVVGGISYDVSEFKPEEAAEAPPTPTQLPAKTENKATAKA